jgi:hypothetical protein
VNFAKKLKEVVASNFIEIAKTEEETPAAGAKATPEIDRVAAPSYMEAPPPAPTQPAATRAEAPTTVARPVEGRAVPQQTPAADKKPSLTLAPIAPPSPTAERSTSPVTPNRSTQDFIPPPPVTTTPAASTPVTSTPATSTPVASTPVTPTPAPVVEAPVAPPPKAAPAVSPVRRSLIEIVAPNDPVDLEGIIREASLPSVPFSAEQAAKVLSALPMELPLQVKRLTVKATMEAVERDRAIEPQEIVADAMLKKGHLTNYRDEFRSKVEALHRETDLEIADVKAEIEREMARLKAEMDRMTAMKATYDRKLRSVEHATDERIVQMEQVIVFFQSEVARELDQQVAERHKEEEEELPPFMRDEAVFRMLGLENENGEKDEEGESSEEPMSNASGKRNRGQRRRFAVAENVEPTGHTA